MEGVPLKEFPFVEVDVIDWDELAEYAQAIVAENEVPTG